MNSRAHKTDDKSTCFTAAVRPSGAVAKKCVLLSTLKPQTQTARCKAAVSCDSGKGSRVGTYQMICSSKMNRG